MSALTRMDNRALSDLFEWLEVPYALLRPFMGQTLRTEEGVDNGRYVVRAEIPGIDPEKDAEVTLSRGVLTIRAERHKNTDGKRRSEFRYGPFSRHVMLPESADEADIEASYDKGILEVSVALKANGETGPGERRIPVHLVKHIKPT
jgi:HSP20 family molecular chaperone IbpA